MTKIMIVDDNKDIVQTIKAIMEKEGFNTDIANNGEEFLRKVKIFQPDLVLLDVMMPGLTTKAILDSLKEKGLGDLKIILVTGVRFAEDEKNELVSKFKIVDYVTKPFDVFDLVKRVKSKLS
jgi:two-component system, OmpR family, alkaline phosphatase synthesis response regulator PhoP